MPQKDTGNPIEQHVEKGVVAVAALVLVYAMAHWVFSSPTRFNSMPLDEADVYLLNKAKLIRDAMESKPPTGGKEVELPAYLSQIRQLEDPRPRPPMIDLALGVKPTWIDLRDPVPPPPPRVADFAKALLAPEKPRATAMYRLPNITGLKEVLGANPFATWPVGKVTERWAGVVAGRNIPAPKPYVIRVETQIVEVGPDGKAVSSVSAVKPDGPIPATNKGKRLAEIAFPDPTTATPQEVEAAIQALIAAQNRILRPRYWAVWDAANRRWTTWEQALTNAGQTVAKPPQGQWLFWTHHDGLTPGHRYSYRSRLVVLNPLYGKSEITTKNPADAKVVELASPWSPWSDPASLTRTTRFLLSGSNPASGYVVVTIFTESIGQQVSDTFNVSPGQLIGHLEATPTAMPDEKTQRVVMVKRPVDFSTGAVVLDIKFGRRYYKKTLVKRTVELTYVDAAGQVHSRLLDVDRARLALLKPNKTVPVQPRRPAPTSPGNPATSVKKAGPPPRKTPARPKGRPVKMPRNFAPEGPIMPDTGG